MQHKLVPAAINTFEGILAERVAKNDSAAAAAYQAALKQPVNIAYTQEEHSLAYAGLARIAARAANHGQAKAYYKKCSTRPSTSSLFAKRRRISSE